MDIARVIKIENPNCKKQVYFVIDLLYKTNVCDYEINVVVIEKMYFTKDISLLQDEYNLDVDAIQDITYRKQRQSIDTNMFLLSHRNLIYKIAQVMAEFEKRIGISLLHIVRVEISKNCFSS